MCNKCNNFKWLYPNYNYCPICGNKLKTCIFVPGGRLNITSYKKEAVDRENKDAKFVSNI